MPPYITPLAPLMLRGGILRGYKTLPHVLCFRFSVFLFLTEPFLWREKIPASLGRTSPKRGDFGRGKGEGRLVAAPLGNHLYLSPM